VMGLIVIWAVRRHYLIQIPGLAVPG
jgi:hypothetical protein